MGDLTLPDRIPEGSTVSLDSDIFIYAIEEHTRFGPDAIHLASALVGNASHFVTNDQRIPPIDGLVIVRLA